MRTEALSITERESTHDTWNLVKGTGLKSLKTCYTLLFKTTTPPHREVVRNYQEIRQIFLLSFQIPINFKQV